MQLKVLVFLLLSICTSVYCGCYLRYETHAKRMCCQGRNVSCVSIETGSRNVLLDVERAARYKNRVETSTETILQPQPQPPLVRSRNWHLHVPDMKIMDEEQIDNFTQWLNDHSNTHLDFNELDHPEFEHLKLPELDHGSGYYEDVGSGTDVDYVNLFNESSVDSPNETNNKHPEGQPDTVRYEIHDGAKYEIVTDGVETVTRNVLEKIEFNGNAKEISYVIISDSMQHAFDSYEKIGLLQHDKSLAKDCYCDEECRVLNDCCSDYIDICPRNC